MGGRHHGEFSGCLRPHDRLREWATNEPYHYAHEWKVGDTVMWDKTGTMHRARPYDPDCGRLLHRTILQDVEPIR